MILNKKKNNSIKQEDFVANKKLGQNFLFCVDTQKRIVDAAQIDFKNDIIIEIGPGLGAITKYILKTGVQLIAIEIDNRLIEKLKNDFRSNSNFNLIHADILKINFNELLKNIDSNKKIKVVANLPYYISSKIILYLLKSMRINECIIMVQKEMAQRISAPVNSSQYNGFSALLAYYCKIDYLFTVKPNCFKPIPKVDSAVVKITFFNNRKYNFKFDQFLRICFHSPRKTLINNLSYQYSKQKIIDLFNQQNIDLNVRPQELSVIEFYQLFESFNNEN